MAGASPPAQVVPERRPGTRLDSTARRVRRGGRAGSLSVGRHCRPCLLTWAGPEPTGALIEQMRRAALDWDRRNVIVSLDGTTQVLLLAEDSSERPSRELAGAAVRAVMDAARALRPEARIRAVVGDRMAPGERFAFAAARLRRLARRALASQGGELVWARRFSLGSLLETLEPCQAAAFVDEQIAALRTYDREHGTNLRRVLELALDHPNRGTAASAAFMHRNTFRRQLAKALELVDVDLDDPGERLALHVALKLGALPGPARLGGRASGSGWDARLHPASSRAAPSERRR